MRRLKVASAFAGIGGFDLGFERAGMEVIHQIENDKWCRQVLRRWWPDVNLYGDVTDVRGSDIDGADILCGGFPCQGVSVAGHREGLADERSGLFHEFVRLAREGSARWLVIDNVDGLLSSKGGEDFATVLGELTGYHPEVPEDGWRKAGLCDGPRARCWWRVLDSQYFGLPQRRSRVFLVADTRGECGPEVLLEPSCLPGDSQEIPSAGQLAPTLFGSGAGTARVASAGSEAQFIVGQDEKGRPVGWDPAGISGAVSSKRHKGTGGPSGDEYYNLVPTFRKAQRAHHSEDKERWEPTGVADTLDASGHAPRTASIVFNWQNWTNNGLAITPDKSSPLDASQVKALVDLRENLEDVVPRRMTPLECERCQGFPDYWTDFGFTEEGEPVELSDTQRYKKIGNAVSVPVAAWIGARIVACEARY